MYDKRGNLCVPADTFRKIWLKETVMPFTVKLMQTFELI